jgi:hypothetical protein
VGWTFDGCYLSSDCNVKGVRRKMLNSDKQDETQENYGLLNTCVLGRGSLFRNVEHRYKVQKNCMQASWVQVVMKVVRILSV